MQIQYKNKTYTIPKPFNQCYFGADPIKEITVLNRFSDENYVTGRKDIVVGPALYIKKHALGNWA